MIRYLVPATALILTSSTLTFADSNLWVSSDRATRHTCPSEKCGAAGVLMFREGVEVFERKGDWVRITKPYSASCYSGVSEYVKSGNKACTPSNGIVNGQFAEWVNTKALTANRPADPAEGTEGDDKLVSGSDDYRRYGAQFRKAARELIDKGTCTASDFQETGGWMASTSKGQSVYFTYCGGMTVANRIYLDAKTGRVFR